jgi:hypothetical protein
MMGLRTEDHPSTLPRHHLEEEVKYLRTKNDKLLLFVKSVKINTDVPAPVRREAGMVLST